MIFGSVHGWGRRRAGGARWTAGKPAVWLAVLTLAACSGPPEDPARVWLVEEGSPRAVLVADYPPGAPPPVIEGIDRSVALLRRVVAQATGVELPVAGAGEFPPEDGMFPVYVGGGSTTVAAGLDPAGLEAEAYRIVVRPDAAFLFGHPPEREPVSPEIFPWDASTYFAAARVAREQFGAVWLWPEASGLHVPRSASAGLVVGEKSGRPPLGRRSFSIPNRLRSEESWLESKAPRSTTREEWLQLRDRAGEWMRFHELGARRKLTTPHAFPDWWKKYAKKHPDYFALPPEGMAQPWPSPTRVKLRLGNPAVADRIVQEWIEAGKPDEWGIGPNDGSGFCTAPETRALDDDPNLDAEAIWRGRANLTPRYVRFWNSLAPRFREHNPDIRLLGLVYSAYRDPPPPGTKLESGLCFGFVHGFNEDAYAAWQGWSDAGMALILRPNWWHMGGSAPHMNHRATGEFFRWASNNRMEAYHFDSLHGFWATQGLNYFTMAQLTPDPETPIEEIERRYASAFGAAAPAILAYIEYWSDHARRAAFSIPAGGILEQDRPSLFRDAVEQHGLPPHPLAGSHRVLPYLYGPEVVGPARAILARARDLAAGDPPEVIGRIDFLEAGLDHLEKNRDVVALGMALNKRSSGAERAAHRRAMEELLQLRRELTLRGVLWGDVANDIDLNRNSPALDAEADFNPESYEGI